jgi:hypothetical protein
MSPSDRHSLWLEVLAPLLRYNNIHKYGIDDLMILLCSCRAPGISNKPLGLLINFHETVLKNGIHRLVRGDCAAS